MSSFSKLTGLTLTIVVIVICGLQLRSLSPRASAVVEQTVISFGGAYGVYDGIPVTYINWQD